MTARRNPSLERKVLDHLLVYARQLDLRRRGLLLGAAASLLTGQEQEIARAATMSRGGRVVRFPSVVPGGQNRRPI